MNELKKRLGEFYERDDVSRIMPGKNDATKSDGKRQQTRILNDYLICLHEQFRSEDQDMKCSYSQFSKLRPRHVRLTSLISRNTCQCKIHQNMALKLNYLRAYHIQVSSNPEVACRTTTLETM